RARFAAAVDAERIARTLGYGRVDLEHRQVVRARHAVVHQRAGHELAVLVVDGGLAQRLADSLGNPAVHLALDDHRVDHGAEVVDRGPGHDLGVAGLGIDLDL